MYYRDTDGCYLYQRLPKESLPDVIVVNTTTPKEYGQRLLNRKRSKRK